MNNLELGDILQEDVAKMASSINSLKERLKIGLNGFEDIESDIAVANKKLIEIDGEIKPHLDVIIKKLEEYETIKNGIVNKIESTVNGKIGFTPANKENSEAKHNFNEESSVKIYKQRESLLTDLMEIQSYQTLYNIILSMLIIYSMKYLVTTILNEESGLKFTYLTFMEIFEGFATNFGNLVLMGVGSLIMVLILTKVSYHIKGILSRLLVVTSLFIMYLIFFNQIGLYKKVSVLNRLIFSCEVIRNGLKVFSYYYSTHLAINDLRQNSSIRDFVYFYFAPTLVFKNKYPQSRSKSSRFSYFHFINTLLCFTLCFLHFESSLYPYLKGSYEKHNELIKKENFLQSLFIFIVNGFISFLILIFGFIHSYQNFFADLMNFGDKHFYSEFWNSIAPFDFIEKAALVATDYFNFVMYPLLKNLGMQKKAIMLVNYLYVCCLLEYMVSLTILSFCPVTTFMITFGYVVTIMIKKLGLKNENIIGLNIILVSFGLGFITLIISFETVLSRENYVEYDKLPLLSYMVPKVFYLYGFAQY